MASRASSIFRRIRDGTAHQDSNNNIDDDPQSTTPTNQSRVLVQTTSGYEIAPVMTSLESTISADAPEVGPPTVHRGTGDLSHIHMMRVSDINDIDIPLPVP